MSILLRSRLCRRHSRVKCVSLLQLRAEILRYTTVLHCVHSDCPCSALTHFVISSSASCLHWKLRAPQVVQIMRLRRLFRWQAELQLMAGKLQQKMQRVCEHLFLSFTLLLLVHEHLASNFKPCLSCLTE